MTVAELIERLSALPADARVVFRLGDHNWINYPEILDVDRLLSYYTTRHMPFEMVERHDDLVMVQTSDAQISDELLAKGWRP